MTQTAVRIVAVAFVSAASFASLGLAAPQTQPAAAQVTDDQHHIQTLIPAGWSKDDAPPKGVALMIKSARENADDPFVENVNFAVADMPQDEQFTLDDLTQASVSQTIEALKGKQIGSVKTTKLGGQEARSVTFSTERDGTTYVLQQTYALYHHRLYIATYTSLTTTPDSMRAAAQSIIDHCKILD